MIICATINKKQTISIIDKQYMVADRIVRYKICPLSSSKKATLMASKVVAICPDPADIPLSTSYVDRETIYNELTEHNIKQLCSSASDDTVLEASRLILYWHHHLYWSPLWTLHRLATCGLIPRHIAKITKMPLCASYAYAAAYRKGWRAKGQSSSSICKPTHTTPGAGTSCNHIISH